MQAAIEKGNTVTAQTQPAETQITQAKVVELFDYLEGRLYWRANSGATKAGKLAGHVKSNGYTSIRIHNREYKAHRIIYLLHHGLLPEYVDHIDGNRSNNKIKNLRPATTSQNNWNSKRPCKNTSGLKGVCWYRRYQKWFARVQINGRQLHLGYFKNVEDAEAAVRNARELHHGEYAKHE